MNPDELIQALIARRKELKLTQQDLANRTKISRRTIASLENGKGEISFFRIIKIVSALDLQITFRPNTSRPVESELKNLFGDHDD